jgi:hypothetical protein
VSCVRLCRAWAQRHPGQLTDRGRSFRWSFRQAQHHMTRPYRLDGAPDLSSENGILGDAMDGRGLTSNP